jgi:hypothetical protein
MTADRPQQTNAPDNSQHARDLLARLYREIGISAVAAALQIPTPKSETGLESRRDIPAMLRKDLAA